MEELVLRLINQTQQPVFLTGRAGTGKTTLLKKIVAQTHKNHVIVAPTAVAAINAGGVTIHSMFQLPFHPFLPVDYADASSAQLYFETRNSIKKHFKVNRDKRKIFQNLELLVIDEVSMVRPDLLDAVDEVLRYHRRNQRPFGGVQLLFIGDLMQLPPIVRNEEWHTMSQYYASKYFFDAHSLRSQKPVYLELKKIYRQSDEDFINILQRLRENTVDAEVLDILEEHLDPNFETQKNPGYIVLTTHNRQADEINQLALDEIKETKHSMKAEVVDDFPERSFPLPEKLELKVGAQVMFIKNDPSPDKLYYNGKIGKISRIDFDEVFVYFEEEDLEIQVEKHTWENIKYHSNAKSQEIEEEILGTFTQFPIRLAWAITIHKSQGLTFEKAAIDISQIFAPGQAYVALSRLTSLDGLKLLAPIGDRKISVEQALLQFTGTQKPIEEVSASLDLYSLEYLIQSAVTALDYKPTKYWIYDMLESIKMAADKSIIRDEESFLNELITQMQKIMDVADKFSIQLQYIQRSDNIDAQHLHERLNSGTKYFDELWVEVEKKILQKLVDLKVVSRVRQYQKTLQELEDLVYLSIKRLRKLSKSNAAIASGKPLDKNSVHSKELAEQKEAWLKEIKANSYLGMDVEFEDVEKPKKKKEKIPSKVISLQMWHKHKDLEKIAKERKLKSSTILGHLLSAVESGALNISDLADELRMKKIKKIIGDQKFDSLTEMKRATDNKFEFDELRVYRLWANQ